MAKDIKELMENDSEKQFSELPKGHRKRFEELLDKELPQEKEEKPFRLWKIAATIAIIFGIGITVYMNEGDTVEETVVDTQQKKENSEASKITLGDISPDLKKVEQYYVANINLELADIELTEANKKLLDGYMNRLSELNDAYQELTLELNEVGPNNQTIEALINNLQLRLQLLYRLKEKIKELKETENEKFKDQNV
ncbi:hypothetical protein [Galbibacter orientalis]|uniref:Uncharacterized protein n=1 Tax=Galbibacter orientalis DSM 19592 TaxID=926559 RepID=I3C760_9FLAO|nr:hypothetical protein [Galbibacter orientalis]EIJ39453.1 hypothetical protein JoomaDRAFT_2474 [Galbibacter orientalis DSM 19592]